MWIGVEAQDFCGNSTSRKSIFGGLARQKLVEAVPAKSAALERKSAPFL